MTDRTEDAIEIIGTRETAVPTDLSACRDFDPVHLTAAVTCETQGTIGTEWTGLRVRDLLDAAAVPNDTTHLVVECQDGYRVCLDVVDTLDAILAYRRDGDSLDPDAIRLVGPDIGSTRSARGVTRIEPVSLDPADDPSEREQLS